MHGIMNEISSINYKPEQHGMEISCGHICITNDNDKPGSSCTTMTAATTANSS